MSTLLRVHELTTTALQATDRHLETLVPFQYISLVPITLQNLFTAITEIRELLLRLTSDLEFATAITQHAAVPLTSLDLQQVDDVICLISSL